MHCLPGASTGLGIQGPTLHPSTRPPATALRNPRRRGDHGRSLTGKAPVKGPPPHARGPHGSCSARPAVRGTTHACAETTAASSATGGTVGTTHACAGTTPVTVALRIQARDHPRTRGDHTRRTLQPIPEWGPPPHARGPQFASWGFGGAGRRNSLLLGKGIFRVFLLFIRCWVDARRGSHRKRRMALLAVITVRTVLARIRASIRRLGARRTTVFARPPHRRGG